MEKRLYRSRASRMIAGVCGGLADYLKMDPTIVRVVFAISILFGSLGFWVYIVMWLVVPEEPSAAPPPPSST